MNICISESIPGYHTQYAQVNVVIICYIFVNFYKEMFVMNLKISLVSVLILFGLSEPVFGQNNFEVKYIITEQDGAHILLETQKVYANYLISNLSTISANSITTLNDRELRAAVDNASANEETLAIVIKRSQHIRPIGIDFDLFKANDSDCYYRLLIDPRAEEGKTGVRDSVWLTIVRDSLIQLNWTIQNEYKLIDKINCRKATMTYRCKDYVAWFDPGTSVSIGPEQFGGLPGIIVEMSRSVDNVKWQLQSFSPISGKDIVDLNEIKSKIKQTDSISWCEYGQILREQLEYMSKFFEQDDCMTCDSKFTFTYFECFDDCR